MIDGFFDGSGTCSCALVHTGGFLRPGGANSIGSMTLGSYSHGNSSVISLEAASASLFDTIVVIGDADLPASILFDAISPFAMTAGMTYSDVIVAGRLIEQITIFVSITYTFNTSSSGSSLGLSVAVKAPSFTCSQCFNGICVGSDICQCT